MNKLILLMALPSLAAPFLKAESNPAAEPVPREPQWCLDHHQILNRKALKGGFDVMLIGDSITWEWEANKDTGLKVWPQLKEWNPATFGVSGDRTEHVLWRLQNGNLNVPTPPKVVVLMIGTNNTGQRQDSPEQIAGGVKTIVDKITNQFPDANVLLYGIFPRGRVIEDAYRKNNDAANRLIEKIADGEKIRYININEKFLHPDGTLNDALYRDGVHLGEAGYQAWADSLKQEILKAYAKK